MDFQKGNKQKLEELEKGLDKYVPKLKEMGIPLDPEGIIETGSNLFTNGEKMTITKHWWGIDFKMNDALTQAVVKGIKGTGPIATVIVAELAAAGILTGGVATIIGAGIAAVIAVKILQLRKANKGKGVHLPISWPQWATLLAGVSMGPSGVLGAGAAFIHPVGN